MNRILISLRAITMVLTMGVTMNANAGLFGSNGSTWREEALLHDGSTLIVERTVERGGRHEIGQEPPIKEQRLSLTLPSTQERVTWADEFTQDVGGANFLPMLLEVRDGTAYLVAHPMGCLSYNKWGRPNPPYVVFKFKAKEWHRIPLHELPSEFKIPNLIFSSPDHEARKAGGAVVSAAAIRKLYENYSQPEYKTILREVVPGLGSGCIKTDYYGKATGWLSSDWFTDQPSLDACLRFCGNKKIDAEACPCNSIFQGKGK